MATQVAGELYESITGQLFEIGRQLRQPSGYPFNPEYLKVALQNAIEGNFGGVRKQPLFSVIAATALGAVSGKQTSKCFTSSYYAYRDDTFDRWLPASQPQVDACTVSALAFTKPWIFAEAAAAVLGSEGVEVDAKSDSKWLGEALIRGGHTMTLVQAENMVGRTEHGEATGMQTNGYATFFFVETGNEDDPVSVAVVGRHDSRWRAFVSRLDDGYRWRAFGRLLVRNLDTRKLGL